LPDHFRGGCIHKIDRSTIVWFGKVIFLRESGKDEEKNEKILSTRNLQGMAKNILAKTSSINANHDPVVSWKSIPLLKVLDILKSGSSVLMW